MQTRLCGGSRPTMVAGGGRGSGGTKADGDGSNDAFGALESLLCETLRPVGASVGLDAAASCALA
jgi:hypothetical protein